MASFLTHYQEGSIWNRRGATAFVLAPLAPALVFGLLPGENFLGGTVIAGLFSYGYMLIVGLPLVAWINWRRRISLLTSALGAAIAAALPLSVFVVTPMILDPGPMEFTGIISIVLFLGFFGGMGCIAGVAWWFIACYRTSGAQLST